MKGEAITPKSVNRRTKADGYGGVPQIQKMPCGLLWGASLDERRGLMKNLMSIAMQSGGYGGGFVFLLALVILVICVFLVAAMWRVFTKAGQPGWGSIIPIYNLILMLRIAGKPGWWIVFYIIPVIGFPVISTVVWIVMTIDIARNFGRGGWFAAGMIFLPIIFFPILAFGDSVYIGADQPADG